MAQALYRKYRSKSLGELVGQEHITKVLDEALKQGRVSHAYLFTGPRGVGKTSTARILAHAINDLPYGDGQSHLDIIEIDAASNNSVEDVRDLREKVYIAPAQAKYKVYIIDEVHMLSKAAFNAILKTLEEPPAHAIFILATTEVHKLPATIISRTQRFTFRPIDPVAAVKHLRSIATDEKIDITDGALELLARSGDGSFRDSISLLDQARSLGTTIDEEAVMEMLGMPPTQAVEALAAAFNGYMGTDEPPLAMLFSLYDQGFQAATIAQQLGVQLRGQIVAGKLPLTHSLQTLLSQLLEVPISHDPERYLEIVVLAATNQHAVSAAPVQPPAAASVPRPVQTTPKPVQKAAAETKKAPEPAAAMSATTPQEAEAPTPSVQPQAAPEIKPATPAPVESVPQPPRAAGGDLVVTLWPQVLDDLKKQYNTLYSIVRMAHVQFVDDNLLELSFAFAFHQKRVNEAKNRKIVTDSLHKLSGQHFQVTCLHNSDLKAAPPTVPSPTDLPPIATAAPPAGELAAISNIFGGGELLQ